MYEFSESGYLWLWRKGWTNDESEEQKLVEVV